MEKALLAPLASNQLLRTMLVLNLGLQEWIKCVVLDSMSMVWQKQGERTNQGIECCPCRLLNFWKVQFALKKGSGQWMKCEVLGKEEDNIFVVIGNDYGFQEVHKLVLEMAAEKDIPIQIEMVSKAGARVWSVAKMAGREFQDQSPARCALI